MFDTVRHSNVQSKPVYRRIRRYFKSVCKYKSEKQRHRVVLVLSELGLSNREIASRLRVSVSTVKRDRMKLSRYINSKRNAEHLKDYQQFRSELLSYSPKEFDNFFKRLHELEPKALDCRALIITLDVDAALSGRCAVNFKPRLPVQMHDGGRITFELAIAGRRQILGRIYTGQLASGYMGLHTNDSWKILVKQTMTGLSIVDSSAQVPAKNA